MSRNEVKDRVDAWFAGRGWTVFPFQRNVWKAALKGESGCGILIDRYRRQ